MCEANEYDTHNLCHTAHFCQIIFPGISWVPVNTLGFTRYKAEEISALLPLCPEEKRLKIVSLYEAIQLLQHGRFKSHEDNICIEKDGIRWAFHTSGRTAVLRNAGCCAAAANWLFYMLTDKYDEVGIVSILSNAGMGHAINYIRHQDRLYVVDINAYIYEHREYVQPETGLLQDYRKNKILTAALLMVDSLETFANFFSTFVGRVKKRKFLYCRHSSEITWEGYKINPDKTLDTFWPENNTGIIACPSSEMITHMLSALPPSLNPLDKEDGIIV